MARSSELSPMKAFDRFPDTGAEPFGKRLGGAEKTGLDSPQIGDFGSISRAIAQLQR
jgi:hypothetical protein